MNHDFSKIGVTPLAKYRSKTKAEKAEMLLETEGKCWVDYMYPGICPQRGKRLTEKTVIAAHIIAHSKGGNDCVPMCAHCNAEQSTLPLDEYVLILEHRFKRLYPRLDRSENLLYTEFL
jgi:hypothetical protein